MGGCLSSSNDHTSVPKRFSPPQEPSSTHILGNVPKNGPKSRAGSSSSSKAYIEKENIPASRKESIPQISYTAEQKKELSIAHKTKGNEFFKNKQYNEAIKEYTCAIELYDQDPVYFSNRALCFKFLSQFKKVIFDAESSLRLNPTTNYKGFHLKGIALVEIGKLETTTIKIKEGLQALNQSLTLVDTIQDNKVKEDIQTKIGRTKKILWLKDKENATFKSRGTAEFVKKLINKDKQSSIEEKDSMLALLEEFSNEKQQKLYKQEIPETICCKITFEMIKVPAISSSGISYEKDTLLEHLTKVGKFDPFTRKPLQVYQLIENRTLEKAVIAFQEKNPWSFESIDTDEDYLKIAL